jgi:hypothetical protein
MYSGCLTEKSRNFRLDCSQFIDIHARIRVFRFRIAVNRQSVTQHAGCAKAAATDDKAQVVLRTADDSSPSPAFTSNSMNNFTTYFTWVLAELDTALFENHSSADGVDVSASVASQAQTQTKVFASTARQDSHQVCACHHPAVRHGLGQYRIQLRGN